MSADEALRHLLTILDKIEAQPSDAHLMEPKVSEAIKALEASQIEVPTQLVHLRNRLAASRRAYEVDESFFDNMPV